MNEPERSIEELVEWRRTACPECGDARGWSIRPHRGTGDPEQVECQACAEFNTLLRAVAAAREEGRREGRTESKNRATICMYCGHSIPFTGSIEAVYEAGLAHDATCERNPHLLALRAERAAHAAQLVALREAAMSEEFSAWVLANLPEGAVIGNPSWWATRLWAAAIRAIPRPLPDAEAALEKVKEEAVREAVMGLADRTIGTELTPIAQVGDEPDWWFNDTAAFRAALLNALGARP